MGGQGILMRKVTFDKTLNQLAIFLKGSFVICLLYIINGSFIQKNLTLKEIMALFPMYVLLVGGFLLLLFLKKRSQNEPLLQDIYENFQLTNFTEVKKLDQRLVQQMKKERKFVSHEGQIVGTTDFLLADFRDGQFQLLPIHEVKTVHLINKDRQATVVFELGYRETVIFFKKAKEAKTLLEQLKENYGL
ncbi:hypothetical protein [Enterococcus sp. UD-01]|jgi:hypothetical protein|uniref:hypothetical protein n=1 Tax=Enterococcus sp. UD-01 TaxID=3373911 RepID=UPI00383604E0